jgi:flagellin
MAAFGDLNRVNTNVGALDAQLSLNKINRDLSDSRLRLSTGLKINSAADNAAGYSIATKLKSRIAGLEQALTNVGDAKSVLDIAEASFDSVMDNLIEMKTLATQAGSETLGQTERDYIGDQIEALANDINDIANQTVYQGVNLLNGAANNAGTLSMTFMVGERATDTLVTGIDAVNIGSLFDSGVLDGSTNITATDAGAGTQGTLAFADGAVTAGDFRGFLTEVDAAIDIMSDNVNAIGIKQASLSVREETLSEAISANSSARSRIIDTDFAKEQSRSVKLQIMQQTSTAALAQANMGPQAVLGFLG